VGGDGGEHLVFVAAEDGGHAGAGDGGGLGHGLSALADQDESLLGGEHPGERRGGELAHTVTGHDVGLGA
jgi:hypothetical protein